MAKKSYETYLEACGVDPSDIPPDLRALYELEESEEPFFWFPAYGEVELLTEWPSGADHYVDSAQGDAWSEFFDDVLWVGAEADGGLIGYYHPGELDQVIYLDNEGSVRTTGRRLVDHFAWVNFEDDQPELVAFCEGASLDLPEEITESTLTELPDPEQDLDKLIAELQSQPQPGVRPLDRAPQVLDLPDGRLLVVSNDDDAAQTSYDAQATFLFHPENVTFSPAQETPFQAYHSGAMPGMLANGLAPYVDLASDTRLALFDPTTDEWLEAESVEANHETGAAVLLQDERLCLIGPYATVDIYDSEEDDWTRGAELPNKRKDIEAVVLADGRVLTVGGSDFSYMPVKTCDLYDPVSDAWSDAAELPEAMANMALTLLEDGRVLLVRGQRYALYDAENDTWSDIEQLPGGGETSVILEDGRVALFGGGSRSVAAFDPATNEVSELGRVALTRDRNSQAILLPDGRVLLVGGTLYNNIASEPEIWDPETGESNPIAGFESAFEKQKKALAKRE